MRRLAAVEAEGRPLEAVGRGFGDLGRRAAADVRAGRSRVDPAEPAGALAAEVADELRALLRAHEGSGALACQDRAPADGAVLVSTHLSQSSSGTTALSRGAGAFTTC